MAIFIKTKWTYILDHIKRARGCEYSTEFYVQAIFHSPLQIDDIYHSKRTSVYRCVLYIRERMTFTQDD